MHDELKNSVFLANLELSDRKLVVYSWGNVSQIDRAAGVVAIKPSGVAYDRLTPQQMVLVDLSGKVLEGDLKPSSDTPTHLELYRTFGEAGGICHTHSTFATMWAQARRPIPCLGTTGADYFYGPVPVTRCMSDDEIRGDYELNTGRIISERFSQLDPGKVTGVLVANHGPFTWGPDAAAAVEAAVVLEHVAGLALGTLLINRQQDPISKALLDKHYLRKHGRQAYYGQE
jgi:L-ribulose-5-phosphate 4-epimerase